MPIHDWTRPSVGLYHHFHQQWSGELCNRLNDGALPKDFYALIEQRSTGFIPDVLALARRPKPPRSDETFGGLAVADAPPRARFIAKQSDAEVYATRANRIAVYDGADELVAIVELLSPGNKHSQRALDAFVKKSAEFLTRGINLLIVDLFPPTPRDPQGIHKAVWADFPDDSYEFPIDKPLTVASYSADLPMTAYVENVAVGDCLPDMPLFLDTGRYIYAPLESSYQLTWNRCPAAMKEIVLSE